MELVDRKKLIAQYSANPETKGFIELTLDDCVVEALKRAEVIDAAPVVHAKWIQAPGSLHDYCCSRCMGFASLGMFGDYNGRTNYCPNCGAKMDLE